MARKKNNGRGWFNESENHAKVAKGQKVRSQQAKLDIGKGDQTKLTGERTGLITPDKPPGDDEEEEDHETVKESGVKRAARTDQSSLIKHQDEIQFPSSHGGYEKDRKKDRYITYIREPENSMLEKETVAFMQGKTGDSWAVYKFIEYKYTDEKETTFYKIYDDKSEAYSKMLDVLEA